MTEEQIEALIALRIAEEREEQARIAFERAASHYDRCTHKAREALQTCDEMFEE